MTAIFDALSEPVAHRVTAGLARIGLVLRTQAWRTAKPKKLTPTQAQALELLRGRPMGLKQLASYLGIAGPTATVAVGTLVDKGLVDKVAGTDRRSVVLTLTDAGAAAAERLSAWPEVLTRAVEELPASEQEAFLRSLVKVVRSLQVAGDIAPQRTCVTCRFFRPRVHDDAEAPHHCAFVDAPFGDRHLRLDCPEQEEAPDAELDDLWARFAGTGQPGQN